MKKILVFSFLLLFPFSVSAASKELAVPFTSQAPFGDWNEPWQNACEEAAISMVDFYYRGHTFTTDSGKAAISHALRIKNNTYGVSLDENADLMTKIINNFYVWEAKVVENPTLDMMKEEINQGRPVILPAAGKELLNTFFRTNPQYHVIVLSGYDDEKQEFISQEPGTQYGENLRYPYTVVMDAMHDFLPNNTKNGKKVAIFTRKTSDESLQTDGDGDGLVKKDELAYGSSLWLTDSDGDGYDDGTEVRNGFFPNVNELANLEGALIRMYGDPKVYKVESGEKRHIVNDTVFNAYGYKWTDIRMVSQGLIHYLKSGKLITNF